MKDKLLQVRMSEEEIKEIKKIGEILGVKKISEVVRRSVDMLLEKTKSQPYSDDLVKINDSSKILWGASMLCNEFDIQKYFAQESVSEEQLNSKLLELYDSELFSSLKKSILNSIYSDILFSRKLDNETEKLLKDIVSEYVKSL